MTHTEASELLIHFSPMSIHRRIKRKEWQNLRIDWSDFLVDCENKYQRAKSKFKNRRK